MRELLRNPILWLHKNVIRISLKSFQEEPRLASVNKTHFLNSVNTSCQNSPLCQNVPKWIIFKVTFQRSSNMTLTKCSPSTTYWFLKRHLMGVLNRFHRWIRQSSYDYSANVSRISSPVLPTCNAFPSILWARLVIRWKYLPPIACFIFSQTVNATW